MMDIDEFELSRLPDAPERIIGAFFGSPERYFKMQPKERGTFEEEFSLTVKEAQVKAAHTLASHSKASSFDDRRFSIEVQIDHSVDLTIHRPIAVVLPTVYLDNVDIREKIINEWNAEPLTYQISSLNSSAYYGQIYALVRAFYEERGFL